MPFELSLNPEEIRIEAGQIADITATVRNLGAAEEEFTIEVLGLDPSVFRLPEATLRLGPGADGQIRLILSPPAAANLRAASYTFRVRAASRSREQQTASARLTIEPAIALNLELAGAGANRYDVNLRNDSNTEMEVQLKVEDPERTTAARSYDFDLQSALVRLRPGESTRVPLRVRPRRRPLLGRSAQQPFVLTATPQIRSARSESRSGYARSSPLLPWWLLILFLLALLGLAAVALTRPHPHAVSRAAAARARQASLPKAGGWAAQRCPLPAGRGPAQARCSRSAARERRNSRRLQRSGKHRAHRNPRDSWHSCPIDSPSGLAAPLWAWPCSSFSRGC